MRRSGINHGGYRGETINIRDVLRDVEVAAREHGWSTEVFHRTEGFNLSALHRPTLAHGVARTALRVYISAGIHGDEPAGPLAVLRLLRENLWPANAGFTLLPCLNPAGMSLNRRDNGQGIDLNRDYLHRESAEVRAHIAWLERQAVFDLCLCLHEDWEAGGFYVYELNPRREPSPADAIIAGVTRVCPIDTSEWIEGREARGGIIRPDLDPRLRPQWPESYWLLTHKTQLSCTLEAPSDFPLDARVQALVIGVRAALACRLSD